MKFVVPSMGSTMKNFPVGANACVVPSSPTKCASGMISRRPTRSRSCTCLSYSVTKFACPPLASTWSWLRSASLMNCPHARTSSQIDSSSVFILRVARCPSQGSDTSTLKKREALFVGAVKVSVNSAAPLIV